MTATNTPHIPPTSHDAVQPDAAQVNPTAPTQSDSSAASVAASDAPVQPSTQPAAQPDVDSSNASDIAPIITPNVQPIQTPTINQPNNPKTEPPQKPPTRIIALMNQKGGVGKTTTCTNLGAALARMGKRVLMIDLDPQAHLSLSLGIDPDNLEKSMYDLLADPNTTADQVLQPVTDDGQLTILPAEVNLAGVEAELADKVVTGAAQAVLKQKVAGLIEGLGSRVWGLADPVRTDPRPKTQDPNSPPDYVLIDCPPSLGLLTVNALTLASEVIVPMQAHFLALQGLGKLFETIAMMKQGINPTLSVAGVVLCMHEGNTILANEVINDVNSFLTDAQGTDAPWANAVVYHPPIRRNIKLAESPSFGQSIFDYAPDCHGAKDYAKLAESVAAQKASVK